MHRALMMAISTALVACAVPAMGGPFTIDQSNPFACPSGCGGSNIAATNAFGQTFTPTLSALDAVEVWVADFTSSSTAPSTARMTIMSGTFGSVLGFTDLVVPDVLGDSSFPPFVIHFDFSSPIVLTPGSLHTWMISIVAGDGAGLGLYGASDLYAGGQQFFGPTQPGSADWFFSEGLHPTSVPEPGTVVVLALGAMALAVRRKSYR